MAELPEKIGELTEVEKLPDKIDVLPKKMERSLEQLFGDYFKDLKNKSEFPDTISKKNFDITNFEKISPEEVAKRREEFSELKSFKKTVGGRKWQTLAQVYRRCIFVQWQANQKSWQ